MNKFGIVKFFPRSTDLPGEGPECPKTAEKRHPTTLRTYCEKLAQGIWLKKVPGVYGCILSIFGSMKFFPSTTLR